MTHEEKAAALFAEGCNCSQAVLGAFCEEWGLDTETALLLASSFGGGMGRLRETCGAVTGALMVLGIARGFSHPVEKDKKAAHYQLIQQFAARFRQENGSIVCRELLGLPAGADHPVPEDRTAEYYRRRPCAEYVACAARILDDILND